jgi:hypothetical protein
MVALIDCLVCHLPVPYTGVGRPRNHHRLCYCKSPDYRVRHKGVDIVRGKAASQECADCGASAAQWARIHDLDGTHPLHYVPLCTKCHVAYDGASGRMSETMTGRSPWNKGIQTPWLWGRKRSPEAIEATAIFHRGRKRSPETRKKISEAARRRHNPEQREVG